MNHSVSMIKLFSGERYFVGDVLPGMSTLISTNIYIALPVCQKLL